MISRDPEAAIYRRIAADLRGKIRDGTFRPGQQLGSFPRLAHEYDVGLGTIRRVISVLRNEGLIIVAHGQVTRVRDAVEREVVKLPRGSRIWSRPATPDERQRMDIDDGGWVTVIEYGRSERVYAADRVALTAN